MRQKKLRLARRSPRNSQLNRINSYINFSGNDFVLNFKVRVQKNIEDFI